MLLLFAAIAALQLFWDDTGEELGRRELQLLHPGEIHIDPPKEHLVAKVFQVDEAGLNNVLATLEGAHESVNGFKELTCREISRIQNEIKDRDGINSTKVMKLSFIIF